MTDKDAKPDSQRNLIDELRTIREALNKTPATEKQTTEIPLLDEIITEEIEDQIPVLADPIILADENIHQLATKSWQLVEKKLYQWTTTMDNPLSFLTKQLFQGMSSQLASNWEAIFINQSSEQLQLWKQIILDHETDQHN